MREIEKEEGKRRLVEMRAKKQAEEIDRQFCEGAKEFGGLHEESCWRRVGS